MKKTIVIESMYLLDYNNPNKGIMIGGSQRYSLDVGRLFFKKGYEVIFITKGKYNYEFNYENWAKVIAVDSLYGKKGNFNFSKKVYKLASNFKADLVCYSDLEIGFPYVYEKSFAIQHGIYWDNPKNSFKMKIEQYLYKKAVKNFKKIICVDTNFINWMRENDLEYFNNRSKLKYIPNYADENIFYPGKTNKKNNKFRLLYPRRMVKHRGYELFIEMCKNLIKKGYDIEPVFAIESNYLKNIDIKTENDLLELNATVVHPNFNEMAELYRDSYLSFVPTLWSEGTSLSAIESIMCGCPVISTDVGGLGNIVLSGINGYIIQPTVEEFTTITERLINDESLAKELSNNCLLFNKPFSKQRWEEEILNAIREYI